MYHADGKRRRAVRDLLIVRSELTAHIKAPDEKLARPGQDVGCFKSRDPRVVP